jgi:N-acetylglutamate synthase-like GNAT family acetyltransferase
MKFSYVNLHSLPVPRQIEISTEVADIASGRAGESPQMLPVTASELMGRKFAICSLEVLDGVAEAKLYPWAGFISAIGPVEHNGKPMAEIGTLVVKKEYRERGIGTELIRRQADQLSSVDTQSYCFANPSSEPLFKAVGFTVARYEDLPQEAFVACLTCKPFQDGKVVAPKICCDTLMIKDVAA